MANRTAFRFISVLLSIICMPSVFSQGIKIEPNVRKLLVAETGNVVLDCSITLESEGSIAKLSWNFPPDAKLNLLTRTDINDNRYTYHSILTIDPFTPDHVGIYKCIYDSFETEIHLLNVIEDKDEAEFFYGNKSITLHCTLNFPAPGIHVDFQDWFKDNISLSNPLLSEKFTVINNGTLIINLPARTDAGLYVARYSLEGLDIPYYDCNVTFKASPLVLDMPKSINVVEGTTLSLECKVIGHPPANITWLKDNETINAVSKRIILESFPEYELLSVHSVAYSDEGYYTCLAVGVTDRHSKSVFVRVKDPLEWLWPVIGIICEAVVLGIIIFACSKIKKDDHVERPANEREGLLRQGSGRNRDQAN